MDMNKMNARANVRMVRVLKSLGDEKRFQIIRLLLGSDLCVGALARILNISKPAISQHLKILREAGLVRGEKIGYWTHYRVEKDLLRESALYLLELTKAQFNASSNGAYICLREKASDPDEERMVLQMCKNRCEQPVKLKTVPEECRPEQIKKCHGETKNHPCQNEK